MAGNAPVVFSILDLAPICIGSTAATSFRNSLELAQCAEQWGYHRYWLAEHHNIPGIASAATSVIIGHIAGGTKTMRVGAGGIMLPNHSPLVIAEQFGTLESMYPGRIDLGVGRAPGGDMLTARALRRNLNGSIDSFPSDVRELISYFQKPAEDSFVRAIPGAGLNVPVYLLGSSDFSADLASQLGLPFAFASHFAPEYLHAALDLYRRHFEPSKQLEKPYAMVGVNVFAAETDEEAKRLFTSLQQQFLRLRRNEPTEVPPPVESMDKVWTLAEQSMMNKSLRYSVVGSPETVKKGIERVLEETRADEIIATASIYDHKARLRSFEIAADVFGQINSSRKPTVKRM
jgi:luciferase family oxidoreductase group 1